MSTFFVKITSTHASLLIQMLAYQMLILVMKKQLNH